MASGSWQGSEVFGTLCDQVASDHLICMTGAGISGGLLRKRRLGRRAETLPSWPRLLGELFASLRTQMSAADIADTERLLSSESAGSDELILAASLIRKDNPKKFDRRFRRAITSRRGQYSPTHMQLLDLQPRGIMTFNYDSGHEAALEKISRSYALLNPVASDSERRFREQIERRLQDFFLLKAHGSTASSAPLVLTTEGYRDLLVRNPAFRSFVQHLFTNFSFLIVGYGLDDPDFALFTRTMAHEFGGPLQKHVVLRRQEDRKPREEVERHLYGIHTLHLSSYEEIPEVLAAAATTAGPELLTTLDRCLSPHHQDRVGGHDELRELGPAGRAVAGAVLLRRLADPDSFIACEAAYSLGVLDVDRHKAALCDLVDERPEADVLGRTLTVLRSAFDQADLPRLRRWLQRFETSPPTGERAARITKYLEYLVLYVEHKYQSDPARPARRSPKSR